MKKIEFNENEKYTYKENDNIDNEDNISEVDNTDISPTATETEQVDLTNSDEEYKIVDEKTKWKTFMILSAGVIICIVCIILNFALTKTQHSSTVTDFVTTTSMSESVSDDSSDSLKSKGDVVTTAKSKETVPTDSDVETEQSSEYNIFGSWKLEGTNSTLLLEKNDGKFQYITNNDGDIMVFSGDVTIYVGNRAATASGVNLDKIMRIFHLDDDTFDEKSLYFITCTATQYKRNNNAVVYVDSSQNMEDGGPLFEHLVYVSEDEAGNTVAKYYDSTSTLSLFDMTLTQ